MQSYVPAGGKEVFFKAARIPEDPTAWYYGGLPFCWPWFGRRGPEGADVHGCVRTMLFSVRRRERSATSDRVVIGCSGDGSTPFFPYSFDVELTVTLSTNLTVSARVRNTGTQPFSQTYGFHPFFRVGDMAKIRLAGCGDGLDFTRGNDGMRDPGGRQYRLADLALGRELTIAASGNSRVVVWNGCRGDPPRANISSDEWKDFVCVEPVVVEKTGPTLLAPGEMRTLTVSLSVRNLFVL